MKYLIKKSIIINLLILGLIPLCVNAASYKQDSSQKVVDDYRIEVSQIIKSNWAFAKQLAGDDNSIMARLIFAVLPDGRIIDIQFTRASRNPYLNASAYRAIQKSSPVKPHPSGIDRTEIFIGLEFKPE